MYSMEKSRKPKFKLNSKFAFQSWSVSQTAPGGMLWTVATRWSSWNELVMDIGHQMEVWSAVTR